MLPMLEQGWTRGEKGTTESVTPSPLLLCCSSPLPYISKQKQQLCKQEPLINPVNNSQYEQPTLG